MATLEDVTTQVKAWWQGLGFDVSLDWEDRERPISGVSRVFVRIVSTSEVARGSNETLRLVEVELSVARKLGPTESYATVRAAIHSAMTTATRVSEWVTLAAVRVTPQPEIEFENELEKIGQVLTFSVRAQLALEA